MLNNKPTVTFSIKITIHIHIWPTVKIHRLLWYLRQTQGLPRRYTLYLRHWEPFTLHFPCLTAIQHPRICRRCHCFHWSFPCCHKETHLHAKVSPFYPWTLQANETLRIAQQTQVEIHFKTFLIQSILAPFKLLDIKKNHIKVYVMNDCYLR